MPLATSAQETLAAVKESPHWRVVIRPCNFDAQLIPELPSCWQCIDSSAVSLRGWDFPHIDRIDRANGSDWVASWCEFADHREYWRFFQSAQFVHLSSFPEDAWPDALQNALGKVRDKSPHGEEPTGCVDVVEALYRLTEIHEFASRLCQRLTLEGEVEIAVTWEQVRSRILTALGPSRAWWSYCPSTEDRLEYRRVHSVASIVGNSAGLAVDAAVWFFHRFQWNDPNLMVLKNDQKKLLSRNLG